VRFGTKTIEVATFRRPVTQEELAAAEEPQPETAMRTEGDESLDRLVHRDNTFGTPEEDAFRRDFTINALFYDIANFSIIDYTGGLDDLRAGLVRCIGDPTERFQEDPVRMLRAVAMAARLGFRIDAPIDEAIARTRGEIARSAPARLIEEFYKLLRSGASEQAFRMMAERRLLEPIAHELQRNAEARLWRSLGALDAYRQRFEDIPDTLTNAILLGSLLIPLGYSLRNLLPVPGTEDERQERAASRDRDAAAGAARRRTSAADPRPAAAIDGRESLTARQARVDASRTVSRSDDVARDSRWSARRDRALARIHRGGRAPTKATPRARSIRPGGDDADGAAEFARHRPSLSCVRTPA
jgi:tRNA nucleotidyltransferase/poly(A) polymerase